MASRTLRSDPDSVVALLAGAGREDLARYLTRQRWFAAKTRGIEAVALADWGVLDADGPLLLLLLDVDRDRYYVPVAVSSTRSGRMTVLSVFQSAISPRP